jgi:predicted double-glycine peptidase
VVAYVLGGTALHSLFAASYSDFHLNPAFSPVRDLLLHVLPLVLSASSGCAPPRPAESTKELALPDVRQSTGYTCGAAVLQSVLAYFGEEAREDELAAELGATPEEGAPPEAIVRVARSHGLVAEMREGLTVDEVLREVARGTPVLLDLQAWPDTPRVRFADDWDDGHYVVAIGSEGNRIVVEDPSLLGSRGELRRDELLDRWHDRNRTRAYHHLGIFFSGKRPEPPPHRKHVD